MPAAPMATPEFVRWTLAWRCALREETDVTNPEQTERQLRVLRAYADAEHEGRCVAGICVDAAFERGFRAEEVLSAYGGAQLVASQCPACPANLLRDRTAGNLAGCFGWLILEEEVQEAIAGGASHSPYLLWIDAQPDRAQLARHETLFAVLADTRPALAPLLAQYRAALRIALAESIPLCWQLYPRGHTDGIVWRTVAHCPRCKAPLTSVTPRCEICGNVGRCEPERTRKARGQRPYVPLTRFMGEQAAREFIERHRGSD